MLEVQNISKSFGGLHAVDGVSFLLRPGSIHGLIGPNGAGKTTLFNMITGFLQPDSGRIYYRKKDVTGLAPYQLVALGIARSWQHLRLFYKMTVLDNVLLALREPVSINPLSALLPVKKRKQQRQRDNAMSYLQAVNLADKFQQRVEDLSFAEFKLISLARLLATEAELLLLDEPGAGLDVYSLKERIFPLLLRLVQEKGKTICLVEHNLDVVKEICQQVYFLNEGKLIADGTPAEVMNNCELSKIYFGT